MSYISLKTLITVLGLHFLSQCHTVSSEDTVKFFIYHLKCYFNETLVTNTKCLVDGSNNSTNKIHIQADLLDKQDQLWWEERVYYKFLIHRVYQGDWCNVWDGTLRPNPVPTIPLEQFPQKQYKKKVCASHGSSIHVNGLELNKLVSNIYPENLELGPYILSVRFFSSTGSLYAIFMIQGYTALQGEVTETQVF